MADFHDAEIPGPAELAAIELFQQLAALSPAEDETAVRLTVRLGSGRFVGDVLLSAKAVDALNDATTSLNALIADGGETTAPGPVTVPLMGDVPDLTADEAAEFHASIQTFLDQDGDA